ncbi:MAG: L-threonylcarbamoyladenylate synthase [Candidatus Kapabacteria bacterium]|jgi:L-threonylcarbamoyladenylate synthase|nr:L-threonylcarbamoyladenylate synthase [Candidatus Kapabacteria bacterium]
MNTQLLTSDELPKAAALLRAGKIVAFPTETVYGLGARVFDESAVRAVFRAKGRPSDNPLIVHCATTHDLTLVAEPLPKHLQHLFDALTAAFSPGPLTILLPKHPAVPDSVSAGLPTVAVRFPAHPLAEALIRAVGEPLVAPSANRSGYPSPTTAQHVLHDLQGRIAAVVDGGECAVGIESTVIDILHEPLTILRPGSITEEDLSSIAATCGFAPFQYVSSEKNIVPRSPGTKYRHYAPEARVIVVASCEEALVVANEHHPALILASEKIIANFSSKISNEISNEASIYQLSQQSLYAALRRADEEKKRTVIILADEEIRRDAALMNRITKAASGV